MQGVNVVARWIDPATRLPSRNVVASSISDFLFSGNAGNIATGYTDASGQNFNPFGSDDALLEDSFDLAGLQIPYGATSAQYQLTVEAVDPLWSRNAGPYGSAGQVKSSGSFQPMIVTVTLGSSLQQDYSCRAAPYRSRNGTARPAKQLLCQCPVPQPGLAH